MLRIGSFLGGRYEILEKIGTGGMSEVYKAKDHKLNRMVAIKVLKQEFNSDSTFVAKFQVEAQSAACLTHQNVVNIYDVGVENDVHYIVMELVDGITLKELIQKKGKLDIRESIGVAMQVAQAIEAAHEHNIVHRDIKPQNIIISTTGKVKVTDFGIARAASTQTISSNTMGSVHYISPEQARGGYCDERSDIYSLGITLYEMLTGRLPFEGDSTVSVALQHIQGEMVPPSQYEPMIPVSLEKIILKCTQKKPEQRYESATALISDLKKALMTPDEDFVKVIPLSNDSPTLVMSEDDVNKIKEEAHRSVKTDDEMKEEAYLMGLDDEDDEDEDDEEDDFEDEDDDEDDSHARMEKIITGVGIAVAILIVILAVYVLGKAFGLFSFGKTQQEPTETTSVSSSEIAGEIIMPNLLGKTLEQATKELNELGLGIYPEYAPSDDYEPGQIIKQDIDAGSPVEKNTTINVVGCTGNEMVEIPADLKGMTKSSAVKALAALGLTAKIEEDYSDEEPAGNVFDSTPKFGQKVAEGTEITLYVSLGSKPETVSVPDLRNRSEADAKALLKQYNLKTGSVTQENSDTVAAGYVIRQDIEPGTEVEQGDSVGFVVSLGPSVKTTTVPIIVGKTESEAKAALEENKLVYSVKSSEANDSAPKGTIISCDPGQGTTVNEGTTVYVVVSTGSNKATVPDLRFSTAAEAKSKLEGVGLLLGEVTYSFSGDVKDGQVISQSVNPGESVTKGSKVNIVVSKGVEPTTAPPEPEPKPDPEPTTSGNTVPQA